MRNFVLMPPYSIGPFCRPDRGSIFIQTREPSCQGSLLTVMPEATTISHKRGQTRDGCVAARTRDTTAGIECALYSSDSGYKYAVMLV